MCGILKCKKDDILFMHYLMKDDNFGEWKTTELHFWHSHFLLLYIDWISKLFISRSVIRTLSEDGKSVFSLHSSFDLSSWYEHSEQFWYRILSMDTKLSILSPQNPYHYIHVKTTFAHSVPGGPPNGFCLIDKWALKQTSFYPGSEDLNGPHLFKSH